MWEYKMIIGGELKEAVFFSFSFSSKLSIMWLDQSYKNKTNKSYNLWGSKTCSKLFIYSFSFKERS